MGEELKPRAERMAEWAHEPGQSAGKKERSDMSTGVAVAIGLGAAIIWGVCMALMLGAIAC